MHQGRTSITTIANEKMSDFILCGPPCRISGAAHRAVKPWRCEALCRESWFLVTVDKPKSAIRAQPEPSTRTFTWPGINMAVERI